VVQPIITPEAVVLDFERAGVASRTLAMALDVLALIVIWLLLALTTALVFGFEGTGAAVGYVIASLAIVFAWFCGFETLWRGRTPGKAALGLRVVGADGTPIRFQQAFLRATLGLVDFLLIPVGFVAVVSILLSPRDQRLGDMAAGTLVVRERSAQSYVAPAWFPPPPGYEGYAASLDVTALDEDSYGLVRSYLLRMPELAPGARDHLAVRLANPLAVRMGHTPPRGVPPQAFLACLAAAWQRAHGGAPPQASYRSNYAGYAGYPGYQPVRGQPPGPPGQGAYPGSPGQAAYPGPQAGWNPPPPPRPAPPRPPAPSQPAPAFHRPPPDPPPPPPPPSPEPQGPSGPPAR
jgi:uncharacterized RDD family membrane protein YckC